MVKGQDQAVGMTLLSKTRRSGHRVVMNCEDDRNDNGLSNFSDMGLRFLAKGCPRLKNLSLMWYYAVSSHSLVIVANACRGFKVLDLQKSGGYWRRMQKIKKVTLSDSYYVGDRSLVAIAGGYLLLEALEINGCHNIGTAGLWAMGRSC
uniref:Uncharacterized protein n=1 Tax=Physcomitrium patens TaxID=3218 RepID=A9T7S7_PHYPA|nr:hypothetical protein PHYPA_008539 [Physcomitrium patens]